MPPPRDANALARIALEVLSQRLRTPHNPTTAAPGRQHGPPPQPARRIHAHRCPAIDAADLYRHVSPQPPNHLIWVGDGDDLSDGPRILAALAEALRPQAILAEQHLLGPLEDARFMAYLHAAAERGDEGAVLLRALETLPEVFEPIAAGMLAPLAHRGAWQRAATDDVAAKLEALMRLARVVVRHNPQVLTVIHGARHGGAPPRFDEATFRRIGRRLRPTLVYTRYAHAIERPFERHGALLAQCRAAGDAPAHAAGRLAHGPNGPHGRSLALARRFRGLVTADWRTAHRIAHGCGRAPTQRGVDWWLYGPHSYFAKNRLVAQAAAPADGIGGGAAALRFLVYETTERVELV
ncbi:hypothetical protein [Caldimonas sp. KR1-144]|uniref:hypothetical protein n=1 Tax=Caldimonas sp. KR1-144 TaxID=3400911 RepID=UPI003BFD9D9C